MKLSIELNVGAKGGRLALLPRPKDGAPSGGVGLPSGEPIGIAPMGDGSEVGTFW